MTTPREAFLGRVRAALAEGNRAGGAPPLPERGQVGYQGAGSDLVQRFSEQLAVAGGVAHVVNGEAQAVNKVLELTKQAGARRVLLGRGPHLDPLQLGPRLQTAGLEVLLADEVAAAERDLLYTADLGISGVDYLIAETGSVVAAARTHEPRGLSLLPPVHIAVAAEKQLLPDLFDLFTAMQRKEEEEELPSCVALITGPSKTGDIELKLVTGVHGPGVVHVVLVR
jgi:L-lactate dehydrogenase complex protein LldG